jgi:integrase
MGRLHRLTATAIKNVKKVGRHADGGNLYLNVAPSGSRSWVLLYQFKGKVREMGLGSANQSDPAAVSLAEAREKAVEARRQLAVGVDPIEAKRVSKSSSSAATVTFGDFADCFIATHEPTWSNAKHVYQWKATLGDKYCGAIRRKPIADVDVDDILAVLFPVWLTKPETARRLRMRLEKVLDAARVRGLRSGDNPARLKGHLDHILPRQPKGQRHHAALSFQDVPAFMADLALRSPPVILALRFTILTACRTAEVVGARWDEIDLDGRIWSIPAQRMKSRRPHRVPLSSGALGVLNQLRGEHPVWMFSCPAGDGPMSNMAMLMQLRRMGRGDITVHGFRSSFRDWASEYTSFSRDVCEMALAHGIQNATEAAYRRGDALEKRRELMECWSLFCDGTDNVVSLAGRGA